MQFFEKYKIITNKLESIFEEEEKEFVKQVKSLKD